MALFFQYSPSESKNLQPNFWSFVVSAALLAVLAGLAFWAEQTGNMPKATDQLWTAFQTVLGVVVGFIGGEAVGLASTKPR